MMEVARTSETLVNFYQTTWRYNPEESHIWAHRRENLKSYFRKCYNFFYLKIFFTLIVVATVLSVYASLHMLVYNSRIILCVRVI
jgi:hypothetical protein